MDNNLVLMKNIEDRLKIKVQNTNTVFNIDVSCFLKIVDLACKNDLYEVVKHQNTQVTEIINVKQYVLRTTNTFKIIY